MSRTRRVGISAVLIFVIGMSLVTIVSATERWPFSPYSMYSGAQRKWEMQAVRAYGVPLDPTAVEVPLLRPEYIAPFDQSRFGVALRRLRRSKDPQRLPNALADCLARYERRRLAGLHDGPALRGIRVYEVRWTLDPQARNVDRPDARELIAEFVTDPRAERVARAIP